MEVTLINIGSDYCGSHGFIYAATEEDCTNKPYIFEFEKDMPWDLAVEADAFFPGHLLLNGSGTREELAIFFAEMANRSQHWRQHLAKMVLYKFSRIVYDPIKQANKTFTLSTRQKGDRI